MCPVEAFKCFRWDTRNTGSFVVSQFTHCSFELSQGDMGVELGGRFAQADKLGGVGVPFSLVVVNTGEMLLKNFNVLLIVEASSPFSIRIFMLVGLV